MRIPTYDVNLFRFDAMQCGVSSNRNECRFGHGIVRSERRQEFFNGIFEIRTEDGRRRSDLHAPLCSRQAEEEDGTGRHRSQRSKHGRGDQADRRLGRERPIRKLTHRQDWQLAGVARHDHSWN